MMSKQQKIEFVNKWSKELAGYSSVGVVHLKGKPDRLLQSTKSRLLGKAKLVIGRKNQLGKILLSSDRTKELANDLDGTSAILLTNEDPFDVYKVFRNNAIRLAAKPKQVAPDDIMVKGGETGVPPGQAVTELKMAGIDVQIQKGKVVISKDKVLVNKGSTITLAVAKALHTLNIAPFEASIEPHVILSGKLVLTREVLGINAAQVAEDIARSFRDAIALCMELSIPNEYTIGGLLSRAFNNATYLGSQVGVSDSAAAGSGMADNVTAQGEPAAEDGASQ